VKTHAEDPQEHHETILFVDDEVHQVSLIRRFLQKKGYKVLVAQDGVEAVELHRDHKDAIAAVILDVSLPKLSGWGSFFNHEEEPAGSKSYFRHGLHQTGTAIRNAESGCGRNRSEALPARPAFEEDSCSHN
jgi:response regulator RpfG family c-di-GMP phosphodiesterase